MVESNSKWQQSTSRRSSAFQWALILVPLLFLTTLALYFLVADVGVVSSIMEANRNQTDLSWTEHSSADDSGGGINKTKDMEMQLDITTVLSSLTTKKEQSSTTLRAITTTINRQAESPSSKIKITNSNTTVIFLRKDNNKTEFVLEDRGFANHRDVFEIVKPPDLRNKKNGATFTNGHSNFELATPRGFQYSATVPLLVKQAVATPDPTTVSYKNIDEAVCFSPRIPFCEGILPYDMVQLPNLPDVSIPYDLDAMLPYFEMIVKSNCSLRSREFICSVLEPECQPPGTRHKAPCRVNCRVLAEDCKEFILKTLPLSQIFDCRRYPDWDDNQDCINLTKGKCLREEFQCSDESCIPRKWTCDGIHDCPGGKPSSDEISCAECSNQEFRCIIDGKCIPRHWHCDGSVDCKDSSDEASC